MIEVFKDSLLTTYSLMTCSFRTVMATTIRIKSRSRSLIRDPGDDSDSSNPNNHITDGSHNNCNDCRCPDSTASRIQSHTGVSEHRGP